MLLSVKSLNQIENNYWYSKKLEICRQAIAITINNLYIPKFELGNWLDTFATDEPSVLKRQAIPNAYT